MFFPPIIDKKASKITQIFEMQSFLLINSFLYFKSTHSFKVAIVDNDVNLKGNL